MISKILFTISGFLRFKDGTPKEQNPAADILGLLGAIIWQIEKEFD